MGLGVGGYLRPSVTVESIFFFSFSLPFPFLLSFFHFKDFTSAFDSEIESPSRLTGGRGHARCLSSSSSLFFLSLWK